MAETQAECWRSAKQILEAMVDCEREARAAMKRGEELDWQTDPIAVEYRRLMCAWWALPNSCMNELYKWQDEYPFTRRQLTAKGELRQTAHLVRSDYNSMLSGEWHYRPTKAEKQRADAERPTAVALTAFVRRLKGAK